MYCVRHMDLSFFLQENSPSVARVQSVEDLTAMEIVAEDQEILDKRRQTIKVNDWWKTSSFLIMKLFSLALTEI